MFPDEVIELDLEPLDIAGRTDRTRSIFGLIEGPWYASVQKSPYRSKMSSFLSSFHHFQGKNGLPVRRIPKRFLSLYAYQITIMGISMMEKTFYKFLIISFLFLSLFF